MPDAARPSSGHRRLARLLLLSAAVLPAAAYAADGSKPPADAKAGAVELPAINVAGEGGARAPVDGYVATQSVTATKTDTSILETPRSLSVVTRDQITEQYAMGLNQTLRYAAGVTTETRGAVATRYDQLNIRGFNGDYYLDGLKLPQMYYTGPQIDSAFLERVEVLKGPGSTLYGQAKAGGVINQSSKLPLDAPLREVGFAVGNFQHARATADFSGPIDAEKKFLYRVSGVGLSEQGQFDHTRNERFGVSGAVTWRPSALTTLTVLGHYMRDPEGASYGGVTASGTVLPNSNGKIPVNFYDGDPNFEEFDRRQSAIGYQFEHKADDVWTVRSSGRYFHSNQQYFSVYASNMAADNRTLNRGTATSHDKLDAFAMDNHVQAKFATGAAAHTLLAGFDLQSYNGSYTAGFGVAPTIDVFNPVYYRTIAMPTRRRSDVEGDQYGVYLQDQIKLGGFMLTLAGRSDWADSRVETATSRAKKSDQAFTGAAALSYLFGNGVAPYVSYAESFTPTTGTDFYGAPFDPERGSQIEAGVKYQPPGSNALITAAAFELNRENLLTSDPAHPGLSIQTGEARSRGFEVEARASLTNNLDLVAGYTYLDTVYTKDNSGLQGKRLAAIPRHMASAWAFYRFAEGPLNGLGLGGGLRYVGETLNPTNTISVPAFTLVDAALSYDLGAASSKLEGAELTLNAKNLLDKEYVASCYYGTWCAYGYQRTVTAGLRYRW